MNVKLNTKNLFNKIKARYSVKPIRSQLTLLHKKNIYRPRNPLLPTIRVFVAFKGVEIKSGNLYNRLQADSVNELQTLLNSDRSLHSLTEALWRVYRSNNLQLRHSFVELIRAVTEQSFQLREMTKETKTFYLTSKELQRRIVNRVNLIYGAMLIRREMLHTVTTAHGNVQKIRKIDFRRINDVHKTFAYKQMGLTFEKIQFRDNLGVFSILEKIYEGIESNYLFYNNSSYSSVRTLYRLTNSLWKVYNSQNLELSRNFTRLIMSITEKHTRAYTKPHNMFKTTQSLYNLVDALRQVFSGNNLHLKKSLVSLVSDIHKEGQTTVKNEKRHDMYFLLLHPRRKREVIGENTYNINEETIQKLIDDKAKSLKGELQNPKIITAPNTEAIVSEVMSRIKDEQARQWRFEKLQRGLF